MAQLGSLRSKRTNTGSCSSLSAVLSIVDMGHVLSTNHVDAPALYTVLKSARSYRRLFGYSRSALTANTALDLRVGAYHNVRSSVKASAEGYELGRALRHPCCDQTSRVLCRRFDFSVGTQAYSDIGAHAAQVRSRRVLLWILAVSESSPPARWHM